MFCDDYYPILASYTACSYPGLTSLVKVHMINLYNFYFVFVIVIKTWTGMFVFDVLVDIVGYRWHLNKLSRSFYRLCCYDWFRKDPMAFP